MSPNLQQRRTPHLVVTEAWLFWTVIAFLGLLGFMFWLLFQWGLFSGAPAAGEGTKLIAGVLALVGTVLTGALTFVGLLLRLAQEERSLQIKTDAEARRAEAENRLNMEAAIHAVRLMGNDLDGRPVANAQRGGAVMALANLGQSEFALALADQAWSERLIDLTSAVWLIDSILGAEHPPQAQRQAASLLYKHAEDLHVGNDFYWPESFSSIWPRDIDAVAKSTMFDTLLSVLMSQNFRWWNRSLIILKGCIDVEDQPTHISAAAASAAEVILDWRYPGAQSTVLLGEPPVSTDEIRKIIVMVRESGAQPGNRHATRVETLKGHVGAIAMGTDRPDTSS